MAKQAAERRAEVLHSIDFDNSEIIDLVTPSTITIASATSSPEALEIIVLVTPGTTASSPEGSNIATSITFDRP